MASAERMAIAENLSIDHSFLMFISQTLDTDGNLAYKPYNRFPIGGHALIKLAILPFEDDLSAKIYAARILMLLFFAAAAVLAYMSLRRLASSRWIALTVTLMAFSSPFLLYYNDEINPEISMDLFAVMLVFHGMTIFEQEGRFRQILLKSCAALLLGWHMYALLLPFIVFGLIRELIKARASDSASPFALRQLKMRALSLTRSRYPVLGVAALIFGISVLSFNFTNEYFALNREIPLTKTPSFNSMINRIGVGSYFKGSERYADYLRWPAFMERQFYRIGAMSLPYAFSPTFVEQHAGAPPRLFVGLGIASFGASLIGLLFVRRHKILLASLALSGFCWALPVRHHVAYPWHNFDAIFYIAVTLTLFSMILLWLRRISSERLIAALSIAALLIFALSALRMSQLNNPDQPAELHEDTIADFEVIRNMTDRGKVIQANAMPRFHKNVRDLVSYYLSGRTIMNGGDIVHSELSPDFVVTRARADGLASLTPQNRMVFLYEWDDYHTHIDETIKQAGEPLIRSGFDVYLSASALMYVKNDCSEDDISKKFFLALYPADESALPSEARQYGYENLDFHFREYAVRRAEQCIAITPLPEYDIDHIHTGQYIQQADGSTERLWGEFRLVNDQLRHMLMRIDELIEQAGEPLIRSDFDVYLNANALIYVKDACSENDTDAPFFLATFPVDESALPAGSMQRGFDNLDFYFHEYGIRRNGEQCVAVARLPDYDIARIYTGQYIQQADGSTEHTWEGEARLTEAAP